jgi:hypothetical protein
MPLLQAFPFPNTQGEVTLHQLSQTCVFVTAHVGGGSSLLSCGVFLPPALSQAFLLLVAGWALRVPPSPARPGLFIYSSGRDSPPQPFGGQGAPPSLLCVFIVLITYYSVSLFFPGWGLVWPRVVCGSTAYCLAHLVVRIFPSCLGMDVWQRPGGPPGFSVQREVEMLCTGWRCGGVKVLPLLGGLACNVCLLRVSKISL